MSYISPIKIEEIQQMEEGWADKMSKYIAGEVDSLILESCVKVGCHVDKDELEKALRYDRDQYDKGYADGKRDAASPWHRVEEELPEPHKDVLVSGMEAINNSRVYKVMVNDDGTWRPIDYAPSIIWDYWMPIEPPQEVQDGQE